MRITDVRTVYVKRPDIRDRTDSSQDALLILVDTDAGLTGIGEVDSCPAVVAAVVNAPASHTQVHGLRDLLVGEDPLDTARLWAKMYRGTIYYGRAGVALHAMAGVDLALWDLKGKALGQPLYRLLGGAYRRELLAYASYMFEPTPAATVAKAQDAVARGFRAVKFGWEPFGQDPAQDVALIRACREAIGPDTRLLLDVGFAWETVPTAVRRCADFDPFDVYWVEEPFWPDDLAAYRRLAGRIRPRLAAGEQECTVAGFQRLMDEGRVDVIQIDLTRVGLTQALVVAELARQRNVEVCNHGFTTGINIAAAAHFLAALPHALMLEYCAEPGPITEALIPDRPAVRDGYVQVPDAPGLGVTIDWHVVDQYRADLTQ